MFGWVWVEAAAGFSAAWARGPVGRTRGDATKSAGIRAPSAECFCAVTRGSPQEMEMPWERSLLIPSHGKPRGQPMWNSLLGSSRLNVVPHSIGVPWMAVNEARRGEGMPDIEHVRRRGTR